MEALGEGEAEILDAWVAELRAGPPYAVVKRIEQEPRVATRGFDGFKITG